MRLRLHLPHPHMPDVHIDREKLEQIGTAALLAAMAALGVALVMLTLVKPPPQWAHIL